MLSELEKAEREVYKKSMEENHFNQSKVAQALKVSRGTVRAKLNKYFKGIYFKGE